MQTFIRITYISGGYMGKKAVLEKSLNDLFDYCNSKIVPLKDVKGKKYIELDKGKALLIDEQLSIKKNVVIENTLPLLGPSRKRPDKKSVRQELDDYLSDKIYSEPSRPSLKQQYIENFVYDWTTKKRFKTIYYFKLGNILPPSKKFVISKDIFINKANRIRNLRPSISNKPQSDKYINRRLYPVLLPYDTILVITLSNGAFPYNSEEALDKANAVVDLINLFYCSNNNKQKVYLINVEDYNVPTKGHNYFVAMDPIAMFQNSFPYDKLIFSTGRSWEGENEGFLIKTDELKNISTNLKIYQIISNKKDELCIKTVTAFNLIGDALRNKDITTSLVQIMIGLDSLLSQESNNILNKYIQSKNLSEHRLFSRSKQNYKWGWKKTQIADVVSYLVAFDSDGFLTTKQFMLKMGRCRDDYVHDGKQSFTEDEYKVFADVTVSFIRKLFLLLLVDPKIKTTDDLWDYCHQYLIVHSEKVNQGIVADDVNVTDKELTVTDPANLLDKWLKDHF